MFFFVLYLGDNKFPMIKKTIGIILIACCSVAGVSAQANIDTLRHRVEKGDTKALYELAPYLDNDSRITEYLGWHVLQTPLSSIAQRIISENSFFTNQELLLSSETTSKSFLNFIELNKDKLVFSRLAGAFMITPLEQRDAEYGLRALSPSKKKELESKKNELTGPDWVHANKIDSLLQKQDPRALVEIASVLLRSRLKFNGNPDNYEECVDLLWSLTGTEFAVKNEKNKLMFMSDAYDETVRLNLLVYFLQHYKEYVWDDSQQLFVRPGAKIDPAGIEQVLFESLSNENDSVARDAFIRLSQSDPTTVASLSMEHAQNFALNTNYSLPIFPFSFLRQMSLLTDYCRKNAIDYNGSEALRKSIDSLTYSLSFAQRYALENRLINTMTLEEITAFEYWSLVNESSYSYTNSAGRILDIFYSKNWNKLLADKKQLDCYLKKSLLFDGLGIIGICNAYLKKFIHASPAVLEELKRNQYADPYIKNQVDTILKLNTTPSPKKEKVIYTWVGNKDERVTGLERKIYALTKNVSDSAKTEEAIGDLVAKITYGQLGEALKAIENYNYRYKWSKYSFLGSDFGFIPDVYQSKAALDELMKNYSQMTEYELYAYYLAKAGVDFKKADGSLDYDKMYELLKYDVVYAFVGGGGGKEDNEVYHVVKLLELTFGTTLGFPHKLCNSSGTWGCDCTDRAAAWMKYMEDKKLLREPHAEPVSFNYK